MASKKLEKQMEEEEMLAKAMDEFEASLGGEWVEDTQVGLPPYWKPRSENGPAIGQSFCGIPMMIDDKDKNFIRYVIQATRTMKCWKGPVDNAEEVIIHAGDLFTVSNYSGLNLDKYFGFEIAAIVVSDEQLAPTEEIAVRNFYRWKVKVPLATMKQLQEIRREETELLRLEVQNQARRRLLERKKEIAEIRKGSPQLASSSA